MLTTAHDDVQFYDLPEGVQVVSLQYALTTALFEIEQNHARAARYLTTAPAFITAISYLLPPLAAAAACPGLGLLAPYFERPRRRFETPSLSSVPRTI